MQFFGVEADTISITGPLGDVTVPPNLLPGSSAYFGVFEVDNNVIVPGTYIVRTKSAGEYDVLLSFFSLFAFL